MGINIVTIAIIAEINTLDLLSKLFERSRSFVYSSLATSSKTGADGYSGLGSSLFSISFCGIFYCFRMEICGGVCSCKSNKRVV